MVPGADYESCIRPCSQGMMQGSFKTVIFQQIVLKTDQVKKLFAIVDGEVYPVRLWFHILPDVLRRKGSKTDSRALNTSVR